MDITPPIMIDGLPHILANLLVGKRSRLVGRTILDLEEKYHVSIVLLCQNGQRQYHPASSEMIHPEQTIAVLGEPEKINQIVHENHR
jgi:K+/H+ antiporter YhaU regulatory subunit KhtT